ncbi:MAG: D-glycerate dehydrogenase [Thermodesulfobacteriota bacterium]|nr:D-glycerate dehydrogenase [Thermodesulfobacteriota bacterium]
MKIALTRRIPQPGLERLYQAGEVWVWPHDRDMPRKEMLREALGAEVLVTMLSDRVDAEIMDARPSLKLIANYAVGYNNIDLEAARSRGLIVTNTPGVLTEATADLTMALLLAAARRLAEGDRLVRRGEFMGVAPEFLLGFDLQGKTLGIFGLGRIGAAVAGRARAFGLNIIYHNRRPNPDLESEFEASWVSFDRLLAESDFLSINAPLNPETVHRFTLREFELMKQSAVIINTGRGRIIKEADLAEALDKGLIGAAGLDVYEFEPRVEPGLLKLENVVLAPHIGSATREVRTRMAHLVADNVTAFAAGRTPPNKVF